MIDKHAKQSYDKEPHQPEAEGRFHLWLIIAVLAIFIFLLFYSQKIHGQM